MTTYFIQKTSEIPYIYSIRLGVLQIGGVGGRNMCQSAKHYRRIQSMVGGVVIIVISREIQDELLPDKNIDGIFNVLFHSISRGPMNGSSDRVQIR